MLSSFFTILDRSRLHFQHAETKQMAVGTKEGVQSESGCLCLLETQILVLNLSFTEAFLYQKNV